MTVRVVIADDQTVVREGLRSMLGLFDALDVVGVASSAEDALALVAEQTPDVLLTDLRMPGIGGIEGIRRLVASGAATRAVALTTYDDDATIVEALDAGAVGFLNKDADPTAIESALLSAAIAPHTENPDGLTDRESEVVTLIAQGLSNQQIARSLVVGVSTVKTHINHILAKTGCRDRAAVVAYAYRLGLA